VACARFQALEKQEFGASKWIEKVSIGCKAGEEFVSEFSEPFDSTAQTFRIHVYGTPVPRDPAFVEKRKPQISEIWFLIDGKRSSSCDARMSVTR